MNRPTFLTAEWRYLAMLNYVVDPAALAPFVPVGTEMDANDGRTYASIVGFRFLSTRVLGIPIPFHRDFDEVNLRFYVRRKAPEGWRRGVVFIREIVPRLAIAAVARVVYGEPYSTYPMRHRVEVTDAGVSVEYEWRRAGRWECVRLRGKGLPKDMLAGSEEEYIAEHYWGYTARGGGCTEYRVEHPRWKVWDGVGAEFDADIATLYGDRFVESLSASPASAFIAEGSEIRVRSNAGVRVG